MFGLRKEFEFENGVAVGNDNVTIALFKGKPAPQTLDHMSFHLPNMSILVRKAPAQSTWVSGFTIRTDIAGNSVYRTQRNSFGRSCWRPSRMQ